jgi:multicomponent Na+:H+ antiporter subunit A
MTAATFMAIVTRRRLAAVVALGVVGYGVALFYFLHHAPDVAITQLLIETLTVVLFVLVLYRLPLFQERSTVATRLRDAVIATLVGVLMTTLILLKGSGTVPGAISHYFAENSVRAAHGHNIVNVILVDFRGIDTMGEITVLSIAAVGVYALLKLKPSGEEK